MFLLCSRLVFLYGFAPTYGKQLYIGLSPITTYRIPSSVLIVAVILL